jgi:hypothetical protein
MEATTALMEYKEVMSSRSDVRNIRWIVPGGYIARGGEYLKAYSVGE